MHLQVCFKNFVNSVDGPNNFCQNIFFGSSIIGVFIGPKSSIFSCCCYSNVKSSYTVVENSFGGMLLGSLVPFFGPPHRRAAFKGRVFPLISFVPQMRIGIFLGRLHKVISRGCLHPNPIAFFTLAYPNTYFIPRSTVACIGSNPWIFELLLRA